MAAMATSQSKGSFTRTVNITLFVSDTFNLFDGMCKWHHKTVLNPFLNGIKSDDIDGTCKRSPNGGCLFKIAKCQVCVVAIVQFERSLTGTAESCLLVFHVTISF